MLKVFCANTECKYNRMDACSRDFLYIDRQGECLDRMARRDVHKSIRELLKEDIDIDIYPGVCDYEAIAFCGPIILTEAGEEKFKDVLNLEVVGDEDEGAYVNTDDEELDRLAMRMFWYIAGYCSVEEWDLWFRFPEGNE